VLRDVGGDVVVATAQVLHEGVRGGDDLRRAMPLQAPHRPEPGFQPSVICLDRVIRILLNDVQRRGNQLVEDLRVNRSAVGRGLDRDGSGSQRLTKKRRAAARSRLDDNKTSMTWPC
jgi:hypothetical protein